MSSNSQPFSGSSFSTLAKTSLNSPLTNIIFDADAADSSILIKTNSGSAIYIDKYQNVGINTTSPGTQLEVASSNGACMRLRYGSTSNYANIFMNSSGNLSLNPTGAEVNTNANFNISAHNGSTTGLKLGGTLVVATATQLNYTTVTPGTASASKAVVLDSGSSISGIGTLSATTLTGTISTASQPNITSVGTLPTLTVGDLTVNTSLTLPGGIDINTMAGYLSGITPGTATASKALVVDSSVNIVGIANIGATSITLGGTTLGSTQAAYLTSITAGTASASKVLVLDSSRDITNIRNLTASQLTGTLQTAVQGNITSVGTLTGLTISGATSITSTTDASSSTAGGALTISGGLAVAKSVYIGANLSITGNLTVSGTTTTVNSTSVSIADNTILVNSAPSGSYDGGMLVQRYQTANDSSLGDIIADAAKETTTVVSATASTVVLTVGNAADNYYNGWWIKAGTQARLVSGYVGSTKTITIATNFTSTPAAASTITLYNKSFAAFTWNEANHQFATTYSSADSSTTLTTLDYANLKVANLSTAGTINTADTTESTSSTTGSITTAGGLGVAKTIYAGVGVNTVALTVTGSTNYTNVNGTITFSGANSQITLSGTNSIMELSGNHGELRLSGNGAHLHMTGTGNLLTIANTDPSTSSTTGPIQCAGGAYFGAASIFNSTLTVNGGIAGTLTTAAQGNITSVGTLTSLTLSGAISGATTIGASGIVTLTNATASTSNTTGGLKLAGGLAISNTTDASSTTNGGTFTSAGGGAFAKTLYVGTGIYGTLQTASQPNITAVGTLPSATIGDLTITSTLTMPGGDITTSLGYLTGITPGTAAASKALVVDSSINISGINTLSATSLAGTLTTAAQGNITSVGTLTSLTLSGAISGATTIGASGIVSFTNNTASSSTSTGALVVTGGVGVGGTLTATNLAGTLTTAAQGNITSVGTLTSLTLSGGISGATTIGASGIVSFTNTTLSSSNSTGALVITGGVGIAKNMTLGGTAISAASWTTSGIQTNILATSYTDSSTTTSGTAASAVFNSFGRPTLLATNATVTTTNAATVYIANSPLASTNQTITNAYSLWIPSGKVLLGDSTSSSSTTTGALVITGGVGIGGTLTATSLAGTLTTATQTAITSVGTLTSLTLSGAISGATTIGATGVISTTDTTLSTSNSTGSLVVSGGIGIAKNMTLGGTSITASAWGTTGIQQAILATSYTDSSTTTSGTATSAVFNSFGRPTLLATNATVTTTNAATVYIANSPLASTNQTITNAYSLWIPSGKVLLGDSTSSSSTTTGALVITGGVGVGGTLTATSLAGTITTAAQTSITSVGTLTSLASSGIISTTDTTVSSSNSTGSIVAAGGIGIAKNMTLGGTATSAAAWGTAGIQMNSIGASYTDNSTATSGTAASAVFNSFGRPTLLATNATVTTTNAATVYISNSPITGTNQTITNAYSLWVPSGKILFGDSTSSSSTTTGALVVTGGVGIGGAINATSLGLAGAISGATTIGASGIVSFTNNTASSNTSTGALVVTGGVGVGGAINATSLGLAGAISGATTIGASGIVSLTNNTASSSTSTGALVVTGGVGVGGTLTATNLAGTITTAAQGNITSVGTLTSLTLSGAISGATTIGASGVITTTDTTVSSSASTGSVVASGGLGIAKNMTLGGTAISASAWGLSGIQTNYLSTTFTDSSTAASGNVSQAVFNSFGRPTLAATNTSVTTGVAATVYINNSPLAGTNQTITNAYSLWIPNGRVFFGDPTATSSTSTGALRVNGGVGIGGSIYLGGTLNADSAIITNTTASTSSSTGAIQCAGGAYFGDDTIISSVNTASSMLTLSNTVTNARTSILFTSSARSWQLGSRGATSSPADVFYLYDATATSHRLTVTSAGKFGINQTSPDAYLDMGSIATDRTLALYNNATSYYGFGANNSFLKHQSGSGGGHVFYTGSTNSSVGTEILRVASDGTITATGNIGINGAPSYPLHVKNTNGSGSTFTTYIRAEDTTDTIKFDVQMNNSECAIGTNTNHNLKLMTNNSTKMTILANGSVGIGGTPAKTLDVSGIIYSNPTTAAPSYMGNWSANNFWGIGPHDGSTGSTYRIRIGVATSGGAWQGSYPEVYAGLYTNASDYRIKNTIDALPNALDKIMKLKPVSYYLNQDEDRLHKHIGFIAHEIQEQFPELVMGEKDGETHQGVNYAQLTAALVKGMQEQQSTIEDLQDRLARLEALLNK